MITDRIGLHSVLLPINHNFNKICDIIIIKTEEIPIFFASSEKSHLSAYDGTCCPITWHDAYCPIKAEIRAVDS